MHRPSPLCFAVFALGLLSGCRNIEPAPKALDEVLRWSFFAFDEAEDETLHEAIRNLDKAAGGADIEHQDGTIGSLNADQLADMGYGKHDPRDAQGIYMVNKVDCSLKQLQELLLARDQDELYPGTYETYSRTYGEGVAELRAGDADRAGWSETFTVSQLGINYGADTEGGLRRVREIDDEQSPFGDVLLTRRIMPKPADMEKPDHSYPQDWRSELYYERSPGVVVRAAAMWREADFGAIRSDQEGTQRILLNGMKKWDETSGEHCAK